MKRSISWLLLLSLVLGLCACSSVKEETDADPAATGQPVPRAGGNALEEETDLVVKTQQLEPLGATVCMTGMTRIDDTILLAGFGKEKPVLALTAFRLNENGSLTLDPPRELPLEDPEENPVSEEPIESELPAMIVEEVIPSEKPETLPLQTNEPVKPTTSAKPQNTKNPETKPTKAPTPENNDYVAWINIPGTVIDYPVVRSSRTEYYLHHMINGQESKLGCLFSLPTSDYQTPSKNIAIYGHHLSNSTAMFSTLMNYKREDYWRSHQTIQLDTIYGKRTYRIFAVINHTVSDWDASTASFKDDEAFLKFVNRAKRKAFYDTGIEVSESDHILTLITCDRSFGGVQGRLLVMGVEQ